MIVLRDLSRLANPRRPSAFTIGSFDGVHRGHQQLLMHMRERVGEEGAVCVATFSNHPSRVLSGAEPIEFIYTQNQKLHWLDEYGANIVYCVPFTMELASLTYREFIELMILSCPFDHLFLGQGAHLGKKRGGSPEKVAAFCQAKGIEAHYIGKLGFEGDQISSQRIRRLLSDGEVATATELLGHPL